MPTQRFENLPTEKKGRITQAIITEFAKSGIDETDVASIVKRAKIPRGSFYQYFDDMNDVIFYIIELIKNKKLAFMQDLMNDSNNMSFLDFYYKAFVRALEFADLNPDFRFIGAYLITSKNKKLQKYISDMYESMYPFYEKLIEKDKASRLINKNIDNKAIIMLLVNATSDVTIKLVYEKHTNFSEVKRIFDEMFKIISKGMS